MSDALRFKVPDEFRVRPSYVAELVCTSDELKEIVGWYDLAKKDEIRCGLNRCRQIHQFGYVIATKDGRETQCGHDCGDREFPGQFEGMRTALQVRIDASDREERIRKILALRLELLSPAEALLVLVVHEASKVRKIVRPLEQEAVLFGAFNDAVRAGGQIRKVRQIDDQLRSAMSLGSHHKFQFESIGNFEAADAASSFRTAESNLRRNCIDPLVSIDENDAAAMDRVLSKDGEMQRAFADARQFVDKARRFCMPDNLAELRKLRQAIPPRQMNKRIERVLKPFESLALVTKAT